MVTGPSAAGLPAVNATLTETGPHRVRIDVQNRATGTVELRVAVGDGASSPRPPPGRDSPGNQNGYTDITGTGPR